MRSIEFSGKGFDDLAWWFRHDRKVANRLMRLLEETRRSPFEGTGKPEALKHEFSGCWSRRITREHRLVYTVSDERIRVIACRFHY